MRPVLARLTLPALLLLGGASFVRASSSLETQDIRGEVRDSVSGGPLAGVEVRLESQSVVTNALGQFMVRRGRPPYRFTLKALSQTPVVRSVSEIESLSTVILLLDPPMRREEQVEVLGLAKDDPAPASIVVRPGEVLQVAGAIDNIFRALQTLPGVSGTEEFSSRLAVRGGTPDQNLTIMDGIEIHNPYRLFGLTSAFNPETVEKFNLAAGAFPAKYGDRLSSILVVDNRDGQKDGGIRGSTTLSISDGNALFEGPWGRSEKGSWIVSARRTYYDLAAERFVKQNLPGFQDVQFRAAYDATPSTRLTLFGIRSRESGDGTFTGDGTDSAAFVTASRNDVLGLRGRSLFGSRVSSTFAAAYYNFSQNLNVNAQFEDGTRRSNAPLSSAAEQQIVVDFDRGIATRDASVRNDWSFAASSRNLIEAGFEAHLLNTGTTYNIRGARNLDAANPSSIQGGAALPDVYNARISANRWGAYFQDRMTMGERVSFEGGLRFSRSSISRNVEVEPRLSLLLRSSPTARWRVAYGSHSQSPGIEKLIQSDYFLDLTRLNLRNEQSGHTTLSFEKDFETLSLKSEAYYKGFSDLISGTLETDAALKARVASYDFPAELQSSVPRERQITTIPSNDGSGHSYGLELVATVPDRPGRFLSGWTSYSFGKATKEQYGLELPFEYDRRHALSVVGQVHASRKLEVAFTLRVASGFPRTEPVGVRVVPVADAKDTDKDGNTNEFVPQRDATGLPVYTADFASDSNLLRARLPVFARLDLRFNWKPKGDRSRWLFYLEFINATNRINVGRYETKLIPVSGAEQPAVQQSPGGSLPFLPTFGIRFKF